MKRLRELQTFSYRFMHFYFIHLSNISSGYHRIRYLDYRFSHWFYLSFKYFFEISTLKVLFESGSLDLHTVLIIAHILTVKTTGYSLIIAHPYKNIACLLGIISKCVCPWRGARSGLYFVCICVYMCVCDNSFTLQFIFISPVLPRSFKSGVLYVTKISTLKTTTISCILFVWPTFDFSVKKLTLF